MMPTLRAATVALSLACATLAALSNVAMAAHPTPRVYIGTTVPSNGFGRASEPPGPAAAPAADAAHLPAKLAVSALSLGGLGLYLHWRTRRHA